MTHPNQFRIPTDQERAVFAKLLECPFPGRDQLAETLRGATVKALDANGSLQILSTIDLKAPVVKRIPVEAEVTDTDGIIIHVLLHVIEGKPVELEVFKEDNSAVSRPPSPAQFSVIVLPPAPERKA